MCKLCTIAITSTGIGMSLSSGFTPLAQLATTSSSQQSSFQKMQQLDTLPTTIEQIKLPVVKEPSWLTDIKTREAAAQQQASAAATRLSGSRVVTYDVTTKGQTTSNLAEFKQQANATLNDGRGWARMGVSFQEVASGGQFTLVLSEASQLPSFSSGCGVDYSCRAGRYVIINQDRWAGATPSWNSAGGSLRDYRHMVVNHETGHWLGHGHSNCSAAGQPAQVMQQQSISLQGCSFNAWPTASELWSTQLGIRL